MSLTKEQFQTMLAEHDRMKNEMDEVRGQLGNKIQDWEDSRGIHRGAFKLAAKLRRMEPAARTAYLEAFDEYRELADLDDSPSMWSEAEEGAGAGPEAEADNEPEPAPGETKEPDAEPARIEDARRRRKAEGKNAA